MMQEQYLGRSNLLADPGTSSPVTPANVHMNQFMRLQRGHDIELPPSLSRAVAVKGCCLWWFIKLDAHAWDNKDTKKENTYKGRTIFLKSDEENSSTQGNPVRNSLRAKKDVEALGS